MSLSQTMAPKQVLRPVRSSLVVSREEREIHELTHTHHNMIQSLRESKSP